MLPQGHWVTPQRDAQNEAVYNISMEVNVLTFLTSTRCVQILQSQATVEINHESSILLRLTIWKQKANKVQKQWAYFPPDKMEEEKQTQPCWHTLQSNSVWQFMNFFSSSCLTKLFQQYKSWQHSYLRRKLLHSLLVSSTHTHTKPHTHRKLRAIHLVLAKTLWDCTFWLLADGKRATVWYLISYKN